MKNQGIGSWPARRARKTPSAIALVHDDHIITYSQLHERIQLLANALRNLGVSRGDRVCYLGPNDTAFVETLFAVGVLGAVFVPVNTRLAAPEIEYVVRDCGARTLVLDHSCQTVFGDVDAPELSTRVIIGGVQQSGWHRYEELFDRARDRDIDLAIELTDPCLIMYTSGTTGRAKGAVLSHANLTWNSINLIIDADFHSSDIALVVAPLFHAAALSNNLLPTFLKGGTAVLVSSFDADEVLDLIGRRRITCLHGVPAIYDALAGAGKWDTADLSSVRRASCGGAPVPVHTIRRYLDRGIKFSQGYGMTETGPSALYLAPDQSVEKIGAVGVPHFFADTRVVDRDGKPVEPGCRGEIEVSGPAVMNGYWRNDDATVAAFNNEGWFRSGDIATLDDDGYVFIVDRLKDMVISGGENIYPAEVEAVIRRHPGVAGCAVIGVPDERWGEVCRAIIEREPGTEVEAHEILAFAQEHLGRFKVPKSVVFVEDFPRTATGKIVKGKLREKHGAAALFN